MLLEFIYYKLLPPLSLLGGITAELLLLVVVTISIYLSCFFSQSKL